LSEAPQTGTKLLGSKLPVSSFGIVKASTCVGRIVNADRAPVAARASVEERSVNGSKAVASLSRVLVRFAMLRKEECRCDRDAEGENPSASCGNKVRANRGAVWTTHFMMMMMMMMMMMENSTVFCQVSLW
jgi:hypothetical protein